MQTEQIRRLVKRCPFRQVEILADGGEKLVIRHPETVLIGRQLILVELRDGTVDYIAARNISKVRVLPRAAAR
jgi:hypothetical protein